MLYTKYDYSNNLFNQCVNMIQQFTPELRIWFVTDKGLMSDDFGKNVEVHKLLTSVKQRLDSEKLWSKTLQSTFNYHKITSCYIKISEQIFLKIK